MWQSLRSYFTLRFIATEPGRLWVDLALLALGLGVFLTLCRRPKSDEPTTWAMSMLGAIGAFAMFMLAYGETPHDWLTWGDSNLGLRSDKFLLKTRAIKFPAQLIRDVVAAGMYIVFLGVNLYLWKRWQSRTAAPKAPAATTPAPAGTSAFSRPVTRQD